jgi:hypothetical protein
VIRRVALLGGIVATFAAVPATADAATSELLFVQDAPHATLVRAHGGFRLTLIHPGPQVDAFADRPARRFSVTSLQGFVGAWSTYGFARTRPNAAIVANGEKADGDVLVAKLGHPRFHSGNLSYPVKPLRHGIGKTDLDAFAGRADSRMDRRLGATSVFIDDADDTIHSLLVGFLGGPFRAQVSGQLTDLHVIASLSPTVLFHPLGSGFQLESSSSRVQVVYNVNPVGSCLYLTIGFEYGDAELSAGIDGPAPPITPGLHGLPVPPSTQPCP